MMGGQTQIEREIESEKIDSMMWEIRELEEKLFGEEDGD